jgi:hypothetical protein
MPKKITKTVKRSELTNLKMVAGNEKRYSTVIIDGYVKDWVGFGWVTLDKATAADKKKFPTAVY